jgi:hypothetical protein
VSQHDKNVTASTTGSSRFGVTYILYEPPAAVMSAEEYEERLRVMGVIA